MSAGRNPAELQQQIRELGPWFHNMVIGGVQTAPSHFLGDYPAVKWRAFREALIRHPELRQRVTLIQVVVPSREHISKYFDLRTQIEHLVSRINGEFTEPVGWVPIHYVFRSLDPVDLLAYYRAAEVALVTPLKDGMNLVAEEYCTCSIEENCVLVLSEFAGAAAQVDIVTPPPGSVRYQDKRLLVFYFDQEAMEPPDEFRAFTNAIKYVETQMTDGLRARLGHERQALHAHRITLPHPRGGEPATYEAPLAPDLRDLWSNLGGERV